MNQWVSDMGQQVAQGSDPWSQGKKWGESYKYNRLLPGENFQTAAQEGEAKQGVVVLLRWEDRVWSLGRPRWPEYSGKNVGEVRNSQKEIFTYL